MRTIAGQIRQGHVPHVPLTKKKHSKRLRYSNRAVTTHSTIENPPQLLSMKTNICSSTIPNNRKVIWKKGIQPAAMKGATAILKNTAIYAGSSCMTEVTNRNSPVIQKASVASIYG